MQKRYTTFYYINYKAMQKKHTTFYFLYCVRHVYVETWCFNDYVTLKSGRLLGKRKFNLILDVRELNDKTDPVYEQDKFVYELSPTWLLVHSTCRHPILLRDSEKKHWIKKGCFKDGNTININRIVVFVGQ